MSGAGGLSGGVRGVVVAVVVVRDGVLPLGADEAVAEAGGMGLLVGSGVKEAAGGLRAAARVWLAESDTVAPGFLAAVLAPVLAEVHALVLPASPDGRDLAPRLAVELGRPLLAGAIAVTPSGAEVVRWGGRVLTELTTNGPFVATFQPGVRGVEPVSGEPELMEITLPCAPPVIADAHTLEILLPEPGTADLREAPRILAAGGGLGRGELTGADALALLGRVGVALGASVGATRVVTDAGWAPYERQIGTTGVVVDPDLYVAFGISGAAQHVGGLGRPRHVVSVNTDPSCPMTAMADLAIVADAQAVLRELARRLLDEVNDHG
jgi:electron transfer flavoprotein alpha subunit